MPAPEIEINGPFIHLSQRTWVRAEYIAVIRSRDTGSEVVVRAINTGGDTHGYTVWTDYDVETIIGAIIDATAWIAAAGSESQR